MKTQGIVWTVVGLVSLGIHFGGAQGEAPVLVPGDERPAASPVEAPGETKEEPWLGVYVSKPSQALYAHLQGIPPGVGFLVDDVADGGPAKVSGLRRHDFLWKMDGQLLVNESQLLTLLALRKVGDSVTLTYFRGGKNLETRAVLADRPAEQKGRNTADLAVLDPPIPGLPHRILNVADRVAVLRDDSGTVRIQAFGTGYHWIMEGPEGEEIARGTIEGSSEEQIPAAIKDPLRSKLRALVRSFEQARGEAKQGRVRRVPTPTR
ncbi:MAG: PDZ domain-containing protein [Akkermansiaceae bacterium]|nr:PDZ domain-containing protein [Akkermansiaceae bacterium]